VFVVSRKNIDRGPIVRLLINVRILMKDWKLIILCSYLSTITANGWCHVRRRDQTKSKDVVTADGDWTAAAWIERTRVSRTRIRRCHVGYSWKLSDKNDTAREWSTQHSFGYRSKNIQRIYNISHKYKIRRNIILFSSRRHDVRTDQTHVHGWR